MLNLKYAKNIFLILRKSTNLQAIQIFNKKHFKKHGTH
ncbi:hypothetical protein X975_21459, partial [Stegodyphus mimosarum]